MINAAIGKTHGLWEQGHLSEKYIPILESSFKLTLLHKWNDYWDIVIILF